MWNDFAYKCIQYNLSLMWSQLDIGYKDQRGLYSPLKGQSIGQFFIQTKSYDLNSAYDFCFRNLWLLSGKITSINIIFCFFFMDEGDTCCRVEIKQANK